MKAIGMFCLFFVSAVSASEHGDTDPFVRFSLDFPGALMPDNGVGIEYTDSNGVSSETIQLDVGSPKAGFTSAIEPGGTFKFLVSITENDLNGGYGLASWQSTTIQIDWFSDNSFVTVPSGNIPYSIHGYLSQLPGAGPYDQAWEFTAQIASTIPHLQTAAGTTPSGGATTLPPTIPATTPATTTLPAASKDECDAFSKADPYFLPSNGPTSQEAVGRFLSVIYENIEASNCDKNMMQLGISTRFFNKTSAGSNGQLTMSNALLFYDSSSGNIESHQAIFETEFSVSEALSAFDVSYGPKNGVSRLHNEYGMEPTTFKEAYYQCAPGLSCEHLGVTNTMVGPIGYEKYGLLTLQNNIIDCDMLRKRNTSDITAILNAMKESFFSNYDVRFEFGCFGTTLVYTWVHYPYQFDFSDGSGQPNAGDSTPNLEALGNEPVVVDTFGINSDRSQIIKQPQSTGNMSVTAYLTNEDDFDIKMTCAALNGNNEVVLSAEMTEDKMRPFFAETGHVLIGKDDISKVYGAITSFDIVDNNYANGLPQISYEQLQSLPTEWNMKIDLSFCDPFFSGNNGCSDTDGESGSSDVSYDVDALVELSAGSTDDTYQTIVRVGPSQGALGSARINCRSRLVEGGALIVTPYTKFKEVIFNTLSDNGMTGAVSTNTIPNSYRAMILEEPSGLTKPNQRIQNEIVFEQATGDLYSVTKVFAEEHQRETTNWNSNLAVANTGSQRSKFNVVSQDLQAGESGLSFIFDCDTGLCFQNYWSSGTHVTIQEFNSDGTEIGQYRRTIQSTNEDDANSGRGDIEVPLIDFQNAAGSTFKIVRTDTKLNSDGTSSHVAKLVKSTTYSSLLTDLHSSGAFLMEAGRSTFKDEFITQHAPWMGYPVDYDNHPYLSTNLKSEGEITVVSSAGDDISPINRNVDKSDSTNQEDLPPKENTPCLPYCQTNPGGPECADCCRRVKHEIDWKCGTPEAAACCNGEWDSKCWNNASPNNFEHACNQCGGGTPLYVSDKDFVVMGEIIHNSANLLGEFFVDLSLQFGASKDGTLSELVCEMYPFNLKHNVPAATMELMLTKSGWVHNPDTGGHSDMILIVGIAASLIGGIGIGVGIMIMLRRQGVVGRMQDVQMQSLLQ